MAISLWIRPGPNREADERASAKIVKLIYREFPYVFSGIDCFEGTFFRSLRRK